MPSLQDERMASEGMIYKVVYAVINGDGRFAGRHPRYFSNKEGAATFAREKGESVFYMPIPKGDRILVADVLGEVSRTEED